MEELFVVNRYLGDDTVDDSAPNEEELKKKLLEKIEERKKLKETLENDDVPKKKSKKRKNKDLDEDDNESVPDSKKKSDETEEPTVAEDEPVKKKKENILGDPPVIEDESAKSSFMILGKDQNSKKEKLKRVLPQWLANPSIVSVDLKNLSHSVDSIPQLEKILVDKLKENNIKHFFPVQAQLIPWLLNNINNPSMYWSSDVCVSAPTGSGKTLAFVLPIIQALHKRLVPQIRALIVLPVQELAAQVFKVFETYCSCTNLRVVLLSKMRNLKEEQRLLVRHDEINGYQNLVDIVVTTPGRLVDHLKSTTGFSLRSLRFIVIDEADRVMENVQNDWLGHLNKHINEDGSKSYQVPVLTLGNLIEKKRPPQKLLFSATLSQDPEKLQLLGLFQPKLFTSYVKSKSETETENGQKTGNFVGKFTTPAELKEYFTVCSKATKPLIIHHLIQKHKWTNILCFVNSTEVTNRLALLIKKLSHGKVRVGQISAKLSTDLRNKMLKKFAKGTFQVLVSSDTLARGIDIPNVNYVISYDYPKYIKAYVHRIGRTGRAGKEGTSLILLSGDDEVKKFEELKDVTGKSEVEELKINEEEINNYSEEFENALESIKKELVINQNASLGKLKSEKFNKFKNHKKKVNGGK